MFDDNKKNTIKSLNLTKTLLKTKKKITFLTLKG